MQLLQLSRRENDVDNTQEVSTTYWTMGLYKNMFVRNFFTVVYFLSPTIWPLWEKKGRFLILSGKKDFSPDVHSMVMKRYKRKSIVTKCSLS